MYLKQCYSIKYASVSTCLTPRIKYHFNNLSNKHDTCKKHIMWKAAQDEEDTAHSSACTTSTKTTEWSGKGVSDPARHPWERLKLNMIKPSDRPREPRACCHSSFPVTEGTADLTSLEESFSSRDLSKIAAHICFPFPSPCCSWPAGLPPLAAMVAFQKAQTLQQHAKSLWGSTGDTRHVWFYLMLGSINLYLSHWALLCHERLFLCFIQTIFLPPHGLVSPFYFCSGAILLILAGLLQHNTKPGSNHVSFTLK